MSDYTLTKAQVEAGSLRALLTSPGWAVLEDEARKRREGVLQQLVTAPIDKVPLLQAQAQGLNFVLSFPKDFLSVIERANEEAPQATDGDSQE